jgi:hypothetical protein
LNVEAELKDEEDDDDDEVESVEVGVEVDEVKK